MVQTDGQFRWGIWGTGEVAQKFASSLRKIPGASIGWALSRNKKKAERFAQVIQADAGYNELASALKDRVDAIYIATPAYLHAEHAVTALENGMAVLVEEPFASNASDARKIVETANANNLFAMEAMWTRFQPAVLEARRLLATNEIGTPRLLRGEFCMAKTVTNEDAFEGGGATFQRGIYPLSLASFLLGFPAKSDGFFRLGPQGSDEDAVINLVHRC